MARRISDERLNALRERYEAEMGRPYDPARYGSPSGVNERVRKLVSNLKQLEIGKRMGEIQEEIVDLPPSGDAAVVLPERQHLLDEYDQLKTAAAVWS